MNYVFTEIGKGEVGVDTARCFTKLVRSISEGAAFVRELVQNAFDALDLPPSIYFRRVDDGAEIVVEDERGMTDEELDALTMVGFSTKPGAKRRDLRGEFGTGFILALSPHIEARSVEVTTTCDGQEWQLLVSYPNNDFKRMPVKTLKPVDAPCSDRTRVIVRFAAEIERVTEFISWVQQAAGRPLKVFVEGVEQPMPPMLRERSVGSFDYYAKTANGDEFFMTTAKPTFNIPTDSITISIKDLPVLFGASSYHFMTGKSDGDHMPQNEGGHVYLDWNEIMCNAKNLSLNSSRDAVMRDTAFDAFKSDLNLRVKAPLLDKVDGWVDENISEIRSDPFFRCFGAYFLSDHELYAHQDLANIMTMSYRILSYLRGEDSGEHKALLKHLIERTIFASNVSDVRDFSISRIRERTHGFILYDDEKSDQSLEKMVRELLVDRDHPILRNESVFFMGHHKYAVSDILHNAVPEQAFSLTDVVTDWGIYQKLVTAGILREPVEQFYEEVDPEDDAEEALLHELTGILRGVFGCLRGSRAGRVEINVQLCRSQGGGPTPDLVETSSTGKQSVTIMVKTDHVVYKKVRTSSMDGRANYLVSLIIFELCYVVRQYMRLRQVADGIWDYEPAQFEDILNDGLLTFAEEAGELNTESVDFDA
jgi:hypothetical protein